MRNCYPVDEQSLQECSRCRLTSVCGRDPAYQFQASDMPIPFLRQGRLPGVDIVRRVFWKLPTFTISAGGLRTTWYTVYTPSALTDGNS